MKIGILTFHEGINYGAFMQAFSLFKTLKELGYDVEIINYKNKIHQKCERQVLIGLWRLIKQPISWVQNLIKIKAFRIDQKKMDFKTPLFTNPKDINFSQYDSIIIGSDIVWNYEAIWLGRDSIYWGEGLNNSKLISYAPSCGEASLDSIPKFVVNGIKNFKFISVRDSKTEKLVETISNFKPQIVLDPTFLWEPHGVEHEVQANNYILIYGFDFNTQQINMIKNFARANKLQIISIGYYNHWCDINDVTLGPFKWLGYYKKASYVITRTFHGTVYSLIYNKEFITIDRIEIRDKTQTILNECGLSHKYLNSDNDLHNIFNENIDYAQVNTKLAELKNKSSRFLQDSLQA